MEFLELLENPLAFFKKKREFKKAFPVFLLSAGIFIIISEIMIHFGFSIFTRMINPFLAMAINFSALIGGYFIITFLLTHILRIMGGKNVNSLYTVVAYAGFPLVLFWVPHILAVLIMSVMSLVIMVVGIKEQCSVSYKKAGILVVIFLLFIIAMSYGAQNFVILPKVGI